MARGGPGLVSAREAKDLQSLLDMFSLGFSDVEAFQDRLRAELTALEVCSWLLRRGAQTETAASATDLLLLETELTLSLLQVCNETSALTCVGTSPNPISERAIWTSLHSLRGEVRTDVQQDKQKLFLCRTQMQLASWPVQPA